MKNKFSKRIKISSYKIYSIYIFFSILILVGIFRITDIQKDIKLDNNKIYSITTVEKYPNVYTNDNKLLATTIKNYDLYLDKRYINTKYLKIYINVLNNILNRNIIYTNIENIFKTKNRVKILDFISLNEINKIRKYNNFFIKIFFFKKIKRKTTSYYYGPEFIKKKNNTRKYTKNIEEYEPILGKYNSDNKAVSGIEKYLYNKYYTKEILFNKKDRYGNLLYKGIKQKNNRNIKLTINSKIQKSIYNNIIKKQQEYQSDNIIVGVVETKTGKIISTSQSKKIITDENNNTKEYFKNDFVQYFYEAGSVFKPITLAIALENNIVNDLNKKIDVNYGRLRIGRKIITDDEKDNKYLSIEDIIAHSSNVGITKIALKMENNEFYKGLTKLNFFKKSELELPNVKKFIFSKRLKRKLKQNKLIQRATSAFGYGFQTTPYNLLRIYNIFANDGFYVPLTLIEENKKIIPIRKITKSTERKIKKVLKRVVTNGTAIATNLSAFDIYGKTGTAHRTKKGNYIHSYNSTFIGFVKDKHNHSYTIFVLVSKPDWKHHFASLSAVPIFKDIVKILVKNNKLIPNL